jgi:hypothetical protein
VPVSTELAVQDCKLRGVCSGPRAKELTSQRGPIDTVLVAQAIRTGVLLAWLIGHQPAVLFSQNKSTTSNQPTVLFSQTKPAPVVSHQPNEQAVCFTVRLQ